MFAIIKILIHCYLAKYPPYLIEEVRLENQLAIYLVENYSESKCETVPEQNFNPALLSFSSSCTDDFTGEYCQYKNPCTSGGQKCQNGGTCNVLMSATRGPTFQCSCPVGYTASFCEVAVPENPCNLSPCSNGGTCTLQSLSQYTCTCPLGWKGRPRPVSRFTGFKNSEKVISSGLIASFF